MEKFSWKYYFEPTPRRLKAFGAAIVTAGGSITGSSLIAALTSDEKNELALQIGLVTLIITGLGHFIVEFFKSEEEVLIQKKRLEELQKQNNPEENADCN